MDYFLCLKRTDTELINNIEGLNWNDTEVKDNCLADKNEAKLKVSFVILNCNTSWTAGRNFGPKIYWRWNYG